MSIMTFNYDKDGSISERVFIPITSPSDKYFGVDITEIDFESQGMFSAKMEDILNEQRQRIDALMEEYDLKYKYRSFLASKMSNVIVDE